MKWYQWKELYQIDCKLTPANKYTSLMKFKLRQTQINAHTILAIVTSYMWSEISTENNMELIANSYSDAGNRYKFQIMPTPDKCHILWLQFLQPTCEAKSGQRTTRNRWQSRTQTGQQTVKHTSMYKIQITPKPETYHILWL